MRRVSRSAASSVKLQVPANTPVSRVGAQSSVGSAAAATPVSGARAPPPSPMSVWMPDRVRKDKQSVGVAHKRLSRTKFDEAITMMNAMEMKQREVSRCQSELSATTSRLTARTEDLTSRTDDLTRDLTAKADALARAVSEAKAEAAGIAKVEAAHKRLVVDTGTRTTALTAALDKQQRAVKEATDAAAMASAQAERALEEAANAAAPPAATLLRQMAQLRKDMKEIESELLTRIKGVSADLARAADTAHVCRRVGQCTHSQGTYPIARAAVWRQSQ
jgi:hypothetical protein